MSRREEIITLVKQVENWPAEDRLALVQEILRRANDPLSSAPRRTLEGALGLFRTDDPAPSDLKVKQIVEDERLGKYGS